LLPNGAENTEKAVQKNVR